LKQSFFLYRTNRKISLWPVESETCSLTARDDKSGCFSGGYQLFAQFDCFGILALLMGAYRRGVIGQCRNEISADCIRNGIFNEFFYPNVYFIKVQPIDLSE